MLFNPIRSLLILGSIGVASADVFADIFGYHHGPVIATASTGFPTGTASSGFVPIPAATGVRKLKVRYDLAPTSAPFAVPEPTPGRARRERRGALLTTGTGTGTASTAGPTGTGSLGLPFPSTFVTALRPIPVPTAIAEKREDAPKEWWMDTLKRWIDGDQAGPENLRRWGNFGAHM
ncbi:uncharacterized protein BDZ99DRAFT_139929 [Mytilinidion resinicola]|uniref:Uncharacterized protein n=1 Tax=Mytilinidion resinicola TaxID=574789 RepID=A0A6A6Z8J2_9PEZI|nr:uncharacterized protein BDZ99DRAFT_139929 [Mytilinidion resinicola]KAF2816605.1 hypothetical protein BDZ99DRAFT_139929 [Mytilinidion resinicola]